MEKPNVLTIATDNIGAKKTARKMNVFRSYFFCCSAEALSDELFVITP